MTLSVLLRTFVTFVVLLVLTRITGKKQISQSTLFDFITAVAVGDIAANQMVHPEEPLLPWVAAAAFWFGLTIALDLLVMKSRWLGKLLDGEPTVVIENGRILEKNLLRNYLRVDHLMALLRGKGIFNPSDVEFALFETDGTLSVLPRSQVRAVQPRDLGLPTRYEGISRELIIDRKVIHANLRLMGLSPEWLAGELVKQGYMGPEEVFYADIDTQGNLFIDGFDDPIADSRVQVSDMGPH